MLGVPDALKDELVRNIMFPKRMGRPEESGSCHRDERRENEGERG